MEMMSGRKAQMRERFLLGRGLLKRFGDDSQESISANSCERRSVTVVVEAVGFVPCLVDRVGGVVEHQRHSKQNQIANKI